MSQEVQTTFKWNDNEFDFDARDADDAERLEKAVDDLNEAEKAAPKDGKSSELIRSHCKMIKDFFDTCLGEGAGVLICGEKNRINECYEAYDAFLKMVRGQKNYITDKGNTFRQYSNRAQRRQPQNPGQNQKAPNLRPVK